MSLSNSPQTASVDESDAEKLFLAAQRNGILSRLSADELGAILRDSRVVHHAAREKLLKPRDAIDRVYFPLTGMLSIVVILEDGTTIEAMTVGREGFVGVPLLNDVRTARFTAICQVDGSFLALDADAFLSIIDSLPELKQRLRRFAQFSTEVISQSVACNSVHSIEQRSARWMLITSDGIGETSFNLTQEFLAQMLAVRRSGVNVAIGALERKGLLSHRYGKITLLDLDGLRKTACECYRTIRKKAEDLLG